MSKAPNIVTPCCGMPLLITTRQEGMQYLTYDVPDEILCTGARCYNSWDATGIADGYGRMPDVATVPKAVEA